MNKFVLILLWLLFVSCSDESASSPVNDYKAEKNRIISVMSYPQGLITFKHTLDKQHSIKIELPPELVSQSYSSIHSGITASVITVTDYGLFIEDAFHKIGPIDLKGHTIKFEKIDQPQINSTKYQVGQITDSQGRSFPFSIEVISEKTDAKLSSNIK